MADFAAVSDVLEAERDHLCTIVVSREASEVGFCLSTLENSYSDGHSPALSGQIIRLRKATYRTRFVAYFRTFKVQYIGK